MQIRYGFIRDKSTTFQEKLLLIEVADLIHKKGKCFAHNDYFADLFGVKKEAISRSLNSLVRKGYLDIQIVKGSRNNDRFITINKMLSTDNKMLFTPLTKCLETKDTIPDITIPITKKDIAHDHGFDDWWKIYPRKKSKAKALSIWKSKQLYLQSDSLIEKLQNQVNNCSSMNCEKQYIKHPTTYLNAGAWDDDIEPIENNYGNSYNQNKRKETTAERTIREAAEDAHLLMGDFQGEISESLDGKARLKLV